MDLLKLLIQLFGGGADWKPSASESREFPQAFGLMPSEAAAQGGQGGVAAGVDQSVNEGMKADDSWQKALAAFAKSMGKSSFTPSPMMPVDNSIRPTTQTAPLTFPSIIQMLASLRRA